MTVLPVLRLMPVWLRMLAVAMLLALAPVAQAQLTDALRTTVVTESVAPGGTASTASVEAPTPTDATNAARPAATGASAPAQSATGQVDVPTLTQRVTDLTQTLDAQTQAMLTQQLADLERRKGAQIAVLMLPTTGEDTVESYARRVFDKWRLGRGKVDDGILLLVAKDDRRLRIEVGYGLEGAVPDLLAGHIIREQITPHFAQGDFAGGVVAGVQSLISLVDGEALPAPPERAQDTGDDIPYDLLLFLALVVFATPLVFSILTGALFGYVVSGSWVYAVLGAVLAGLLSQVGVVMRRFNGLSGASKGGAVAGGFGDGGGFGGGGGGSSGGVQVVGNRSKGKVCGSKSPHLEGIHRLVQPGRALAASQAFHGSVPGAHCRAHPGG